MEKPLDANLLLSLSDDSIDGGTFYVDYVKRDSRDQNISEIVLNLLIAFENRPYLKIHNYICKDVVRGPDEWHIEFGNRPFTHLTIRPDPDHQTFVNVYEDDKQVQRYEMLGQPEQWQAFMVWLWNYGNDRLIRQAAIRARRKASRNDSKSQIPSHASRGKTNRENPTHKHPLDSALHRSLRPKLFKTQAAKSKGKRTPSNLGLACLTLTDIEGRAGEDQTLQEKDPNGRIAAASATKFPADDIAGMKTTSGDVPMAGAG